jgi:hypothetical protein
MKVLCETCGRFIRYEPHDTSLKVTTEKCPHNCPASDVTRYAISIKERLSQSFPNGSQVPRKIGILGQ